MEYSQYRQGTIREIFFYRNKRTDVSFEAIGTWIGSGQNDKTTRRLLLMNIKHELRKKTEQQTPRLARVYNVYKWESRKDLLRDSASAIGLQKKTRKK